MALHTRLFHPLDSSLSVKDQMDRMLLFLGVTITVFEFSLSLSLPDSQLSSSLSLSPHHCVAVSSSFSALSGCLSFCPVWLSLLLSGCLFHILSFCQFLLLSVCLSYFQSGCLFQILSFCLSVSPSICLFVSLLLSLCPVCLSPVSPPL